MIVVFCAANIIEYLIQLEGVCRSFQSILNSPAVLQINLSFALRVNLVVLPDAAVEFILNFEVRTEAWYDLWQVYMILPTYPCLV